MENIINNQPIINIGCLGCVSDGKSTLIEKLTGIKTQRHSTEQDKNITIKQNSEKTKEYKFKGYAHDEGFTLKGLRGNVRGRSFEYSVLFNKYPYATSFINFNGSETPQLFTDFESGLFYWLFIISTDKYKIADCKMIDVTSLGGDSIYVIKYEPKIEESKIIIDKLDRRINGQKIGNIYYSSLDKIFYIRKCCKYAPER